MHVLPPGGAEHGQRSNNSMETFFQQIINGLVLGAMYALVALGYTMVYGIINLINFAHGDPEDRKFKRTFFS